MSKTKKENDANYRTGVLMILSPAKTLDLTPYEAPDEEEFSSPTMPSCHPAKTKVVAKAMKNRKEKELIKLLGISAKLGETAYKYWSEFDLDETKSSTSKPAMFAFDGPAYKGLSPSTCKSSTIAYLQQNLKIIDPLYGILRPMDSIQPYRLEMATKNALSKKEMGDCKSLADWWSDVVTTSISTDLKNVKDDKKQPMILVNLASDEYSSAVNPSSLPIGTKYIKVVFKTAGRVASVHAKRARGLMARYIAEHNVENVDGLKAFDLENYSLVDEDDKSNESVLVFDRSKAPPPPSAAKKKKAVPKKTSTKKRDVEESKRPSAKRPRRKA